jgi:hypothetical protein
MAGRRGGAYHADMSGRIFIALVISLLGLVKVADHPSLDWQNGLALVAAVACIVWAFLDWRRTNAKGT